MILFISSQVAYEGFLGDPIGGGIRYNFYYDSLSLTFRGSIGIGGFLSYLNLPVMGDVVLNVPVREEIKVYMGGGALTGFRVFGGFDAGIGMRVLLGAEFTATDRLGLGFEFAPLVVKSFSGKAHPGVAFGIRAVYYPEGRYTAKEQKVVAVSEDDGEPSSSGEVVEEKKPPSQIKDTSSTKTENRKETTPTRRVDTAAAEREYKLGLQAYAQGDLQKAKLHFQAALRYNPNHKKARMALEKVKRQLGER